MNEQKFTPMLKAGGLWAKTSANGGRYLTGRLGGVKVLIMANRDRQSDDDPSHHLFFVDGEQRRQGTQERSGGQGAHTGRPGKTKAITASAQRLPAACRCGYGRRCTAVGALNMTKQKAQGVEQPASLPAEKPDPTDAERVEVRDYLARARARRRAPRFTVERRPGKPV